MHASVHTQLSFSKHAVTYMHAVMCVNVASQRDPGHFNAKTLTSCCCCSSLEFQNLTASHGQSEAV